MKKEITIYTNETCPYCKTIKEKLEEENIKFTEKDVLKFANEWSSISELTGMPQLPTLVFDKEYYIPGRDYFNPEHPKLPTVHSHLYGYDSEFFEDDAVQREHLSKPDLVRNGHKIGKFNLENLKFNSGRSGGFNCLRTLKTRAELIYSTKSDQDNIYDKIFNIQENKNQFNASSIPKEIIRLIEYGISEKAKSVWGRFETRIEDYNKQKELEEQERLEREEQEEQERLEREEQ